MKMNFFFALVALSLATAPAFAGEIFRKTYKDGDDEKVEARVIETYKAALESSKPNALKAHVAKMKKASDGTGGVQEPDVGDMLRIYSGKGSASQYGGEFLVGIPVANEGTGMIVQTADFARISYAIDMAKEETVIMIDHISKISNIK